MYIYRFNEHGMKFTTFNILSEYICRKKHRHVCVEFTNYLEHDIKMFYDFPKKEWEIRNNIFYSKTLDIQKANEKILEYYTHRCNKALERLINFTKSIKEE